MPLSGRPGNPVVVSWGGRRIDVFARSGDDRLEHWWTDPGDGHDGPPEYEYWSGPERLDGVLRSDPVAVCWGERRIDVFAKGVGAALLHWWWDDWESQMAGPETRDDWRLVHEPVVVSWGAGRLDVFGRTSLGGLRRWSCDGNDWHDPDNYGNLGIIGDPAVVATEPGQIHVFACAEDRSLKYFRWDEHGIVDDYSIGGSMYSTPRVVSWSPGRVDVFAIDQDGENVHWGCNAPFDRGRWFGPERNMAYQMPSVSSAASTGFGQIDLFAIQQDQTLAHSWWDAPTRQWLGVEYRGPLSFAFEPVPLVWKLGLDVFARLDGGLQRWHSHNNLWYGPWNLDPHPVSTIPAPPPSGWDHGVPLDPAFLVVRSRDMVVLGVRWSGFELVLGGGPGEPAGLRATSDAATVMLTFPPQHIAEEVAPPWNPDVPLTPTVDPSATSGIRVWQSRVAGASRIAFLVRENTSIPLTVEGLLGALDGGTVLAGSRSPGDNLSAIELPSGLIMSPRHTEATGRTTCTHPTQPVELGPNAIGLWRTRLQAARDQPATPETGLSLVVHNSGLADAFPVPLSQADRRLIDVTESPARLDRLELSALGGSLTAHGAWDSVEWDHEATLGRDQRVRLLARGVLFPFGQRAEYVEVSDRTFDPFDGDPIAVMRKRRTLTITEPIRRFTDPTVLRAFPFTEVEITTSTYSDLAEPRYTGTHQRMPVAVEELEARLARMQEELDRLLGEVDADWVGGFPVIEASAPEDDNAVAYLRQYEEIEDTIERIAVLKQTGAQPVDWHFWPERRADGLEEPTDVKLRFPVRAATATGDVHFSLPLLFVVDLDLPESPIFAAFDSLGEGEVKELAREYASTGGAVELAGAPLDLVRRDQGAPADGDVHEVYRLNISGARSGRGVFPRLGWLDAPADKRWDAEVALPALRTLLDTAAPVQLRFSPEYEEVGSAADIAFRLVKPEESEFPIKVSFAEQADRAGGLVAPQLAIDGISRSKGLVNIAAVTANDPSQLLAGSTLLGFDLATLLGGVITTPDIVAPLVAGQPPVVRMTWTDVPLGNVAPFGPIQGRPDPKLTINVENGPERTSTTCNVTNFELAFPTQSPLLRLRFDLLEFTQQNGDPARLNVEGVSAVFEGDLDLLDVLQKNVDLGPAAPAIEMTSKGISASYALPVPDVKAGAFVMQNLMFAAAVTVPFDSTTGDTASVALSFGNRERPFNLAVLIFGGGGYVDIELDRSGLRRLEISLEFGAMAAVDFLIATAEVHVMGGIRFTLLPDKSVVLTGFVHLGGSVDILGLISVSVELMLALGYESKGNRLVGQATLVIEVDLTLFSESVELDSGVWEIAGDDPVAPPSRRRALMAHEPTPGPPHARAAEPGDASLAEWQAHRKAFTG